MNRPLFFLEKISPAGYSVELAEDSAKHLGTVLRLKTGDKIDLTDGRGIRAEAELLQVGKKMASARIISVEHIAKAPQTAIAISLLKNTGRFEWFLEKAAELGISAIMPLHCERTERSFFKSERFKTILRSAMLQSQQAWLTEISNPVDFSEFIRSAACNKYEARCIAHCENSGKIQSADAVLKNASSGIILIGPEGDFSSQEIRRAIDRNFSELSLGNTRLRTETAGIIAAGFLTFHVNQQMMRPGH